MKNALTTDVTTEITTQTCLGFPATARLAAFAMAVTLTLVTLASVDSLAQVEAAAPQFAQAASARA